MGNKEIVRRLLKVPGIDVNLKDENGRTALMIATEMREEETVEMLLKVPGIKVNLQDEKGKTALTWTVRYGYNEIETLLRQHGAK